MVSRGVIGFAACGVIAVMSCRSSEGQVTLVNQSGSAITGRDLEVAGQHFRIKPMESGERQVIRFKVTRDSGYKVRVVLGSGREIVQTLGYVTSGFDVNDELWIDSIDIVIKRATPGTSADRVQ